MYTEITDEQRKAFSDLIKQQQHRLDERYRGYLKSLKDEWAPKLDQRSRVRQVMDEIRRLRSKITELADGLRHMGFRVVDGDGLISIDYDVTTGARRELEDAIRMAEVERDQQESKFRKAFFDVWSAPNLEQAQKIVSDCLS